MTSLTTLNFRRLIRINAVSLSLVLGLWLVLGVTNVRAQAFSEGFDVVPVPGWFTQNNSVPVGSTGWFQGNPSVFPAQAGATNSYIGANFNNTTGTNTISNWLVTPNRTFVNGGVIKFWTRGPADNPFPDRLEVRLSTAGASTNVGTGSAGVGDFTTVLLTINPTLAVGGYPEVWTEFTITLAGLPAGGASGRIAFRYWVTDGGPTGDNSNYIGIDTFSYTTGPAVPADGPLDYNGDGRTDYVVVRNIGGANNQLRWLYNLSSGGGTVGKDWGVQGDTIISGNWDTDQNDDIAIWRPGAATVAAFYVLRSSDNTVLLEPFGQTGDNATVVEDYNNDGRTDFAVFRPSDGTWYYRTTPGGAVNYVPFGASGDTPAPGDYDGNGSADFVVRRNSGGVGVFWIRLSTGAVSTQTFGTGTDLVVPGDYDADGKTDICVVRNQGGNLVWYHDPSGTAPGDLVTTIFGVAGDTIAQGDYNGDGRTDQAIWRAGNFWVNNSGGAISVFGLGSPGDVAAASFNVH